MSNEDPRVYFVPAGPGSYRPVSVIEAAEALEAGLPLYCFVPVGSEHLGPLAAHRPADRESSIGREQHRRE